MDHWGNFWCRVGFGVIVLNGIEAALGDWHGKLEGKPVCDLLGGCRRERLPADATGGPLSADVPAGFTRRNPHTEVVECRHGGKLMNLFTGIFFICAGLVSAAEPGWTVTNGTWVGESPEYYGRPETARGDFLDDSWTYHTVHPVALWRQMLAGSPEETDYSVECVVRIEKPAPLKGFRGGETFFNYQWGREAIGSDAGVIVRSAGPDDYYMVRISSGYGHVELWKTHGGVVQMKPFRFEVGKPYRVGVTARGAWITVGIDGKEVLKYYDPILPLLAGKTGVGVRESRVTVSEFTVMKAAPATEPAPVHQPDFHLREWIGQKYIFDGDEPVAWVFWNPTEGLELREMKLAPGLMPLVLPSVGVASYDYQTNGTFNVTAEGQTFAFTTAQQGKADAFACAADWTLTYEAGRGYVWDKRVKFVALKDGVPVPEVDDPYFYQMVAPQTDKLPTGRRLPNSCIIESTEKLIVFPTAHSLWRNGLGDLSKTPIRPGGCVVLSIDGWGVALQTPADNRHPVHIDFCHWGLDLHMRVERTKPFAKGEILEAHLCYSLWNRAQVTAALAKGELPVPTAPNPPERFITIEPVNHLQTLSPGLTGEPVRLWDGKYTVDKTTGRQDRSCMRIAAADVKQRLQDDRDDRPNLIQGPSFWTGPYLAPRYRIGLWVKADQFTGKVVFSADKLARPKPREPKSYSAEVAIAGQCDWTFVAFETDMPRNAYSWFLRIDPVGEGVVWVDDIEITPLPERAP